MPTEREILERAAASRCLVIDKETHAPWVVEEMGDDGSLDHDDVLAPPSTDVDFPTPFPGCHSRLGGAADFEWIGQTRHYLIFRVCPLGQREEATV